MVTSVTAEPLCHKQNVNNVKIIRVCFTQGPLSEFLKKVFEIMSRAEVICTNIEIKHAMWNLSTTQTLTVLKDPF